MRAVLDISYHALEKYRKIFEMRRKIRRNGIDDADAEYTL
jgi:hypothetical protein